MTTGWHRRTVLLIALLTGLGGCAAATPRPADHFLAEPQLQSFIDTMVTQHGFQRPALEKLFAQAHLQQSILTAMARPAESKPWYQYRPIFLTPARIAGGVAFWNQHADTLQRAAQQYGVDPEYIVAIIGVETRYGHNTGSYRVLDSLSTLAFDYPPRADFFRKELAQFLLLSRDEHFDPLKVKGSYAGAMGDAQFIPSSYRRYAVDFDGDGKRDLWDSPADAIGSVANYLHAHGWAGGQPVAVRARIDAGATLQPLLDKGLEPSIPLADLRRDGVQPDSALPAGTRAALIQLDGRGGPEYWLGLNNFYVITRYNRSPLYAMAVTQLGAAIRAARSTPAAP